MRRCICCASLSTLSIMFDYVKNISLPLGGCCIDHKQQAIYLLCIIFHYKSHSSLHVASDGHKKKDPLQEVSTNKKMKGRILMKKDRETMMSMSIGFCTTAHYIALIKFTYKHILPHPHRTTGNFRPGHPPTSTPGRDYD